VKDVVREYWKSAAACAAGSFLLSLLVGLITRNPFGVVFLRAFLLAVLFAGLAAALRYLVRTHLLEVAKEGASARPEGADTRDDRRGERVDIVLPEENPIGRERHGSSSRESRPFGSEGENPSPLGAGLGEDGMILNAGLGEGVDVPGGLGADVPGGFGADETSSEGLEELVEELAEGAPQSAEHIGSQRGEDDEVRGDSVEEDDVQESAGPIIGPGRGISDARDGLPDISNLETATETNADERAALKGTRPGGLRTEDALREAVSGQDPATIARAIRTVLKRENKG
jgi:hypothetical protein